MRVTQADLRERYGLPLYAKRIRAHGMPIRQVVSWIEPSEIKTEPWEAWILSAQGEPHVISIYPKIDDALKAIDAFVDSERRRQSSERKRLDDERAREIAEQARQYRLREKLKRVREDEKEYIRQRRAALDAEREADRERRKAAGASKANRRTHDAAVHHRPKIDSDAKSSGAVGVAIFWCIVLFILVQMVCVDGT